MRVRWVSVPAQMLKLLLRTTPLSSTGLVTNSILFCFLFVNVNVNPSWGKHYSLPFLPATPSSPSHALLPELQRYKDTVRCAALGAEVPGHRQEQLTQTLIVRLLKTHIFTTDPWLWKVSIQNRIESVSRPGQHFPWGSRRERCRLPRTGTLLSPEASRSGECTNCLGSSRRTCACESTC